MVTRKPLKYRNHT